jgi:coiled-coil domain-containing protein 130
MPYHIWCEGCNALIATGIRFNAEKKAVGNYHSTKIYEFTMRCRFCSHTIVIRTDPQARDYVVVSGAKRKTMDYDPADAGVADLPTEEERTAISKDPLRSLERIVDDKRNAEARRPQLERLEADREIWFDDYSISRRLRKNLRVSSNRHN